MSELTISEDSLLTIHSPNYMSALCICTDDFVTIQYEKPMPNWWWRMWQYLLLGFKWTKIQGSSDSGREK